MSPLARKTLVGFAKFLLILGTGIFLPAGTIHYWQAWTYIAVYLTSGIFITAYLYRHDPQLLERRLDSGPAHERQKTQKVIMVFATAGYFALLIVPALDHRYMWSHVPVSIVILGDVLVVLGSLAILRVFRENSFTAATIQVVSNQTVISTGPYAIVRHPMYAVAFWQLFGTPLALGSYWGLLVLAVMLPVLIWRLLHEERFLASNLPGYTEYCQKVRWRLMPGIF